LIFSCAFQLNEAHAFVCAATVPADAHCNSHEPALLRGASARREKSRDRVTILCEGKQLSRPPPDIYLRRCARQHLRRCARQHSNFVNEARAANLHRICFCVLPPEMFPRVASLVTHCGAQCEKAECPTVPFFRVLRKLLLS